MISSLMQYEFIQNAFLTGILIGFIAPLIGVFVVVRRLSLLADALSHITLAGIAFSLFLDKKIGSIQILKPIYMGMVFSVLGALFIERLRKVYKHYEELAIPIILSGGVGLSVIFISLADGFNTDLFNFLFGSVTAVSRTDLWTIVCVTVFVVLIIFLLFKELFVLSFDEEHAIVSGVNAKIIHFLFIIMVALVIAASIRIVGVLLVSALMTLPVAASIRVAKGFKEAIVYSILFGELAVISGLVSAYYLDIAPGGTIVIFSILLLGCSIYWKKIKAYFRKKLEGTV